MAKKSLSRESQPTANVFRGWIKTTEDALLVFEAARKGIVPRVTRRFHKLEKDSILTSGVVVVFTEEESGIKRWTDPYLWSASRVMGNFMIYREREDSESTNPAPYLRINPEHRFERHSDFELERIIYGSWNKGRGLKEDGLMKKTISMSIEGVMYHLVSYYNASDIRTGELRAARSIPELANVELSNELLLEVHRLRQPPHVDKDHTGKLYYVGERYNAYTISFNDEEPSPSYSPSFHQNTVTPWSTPEDTKPLIPFTIPTSSPTSSATDSTYSPSLSETPSLPDSMVYTFPIVPRIRSTKSARDQSKARFSPYTQSKRSSHTRAHPHSLSHTRSTSSLTDTSEIYPPTPYSCHPSHQMLEAGTLPSSSSFSSNVRVAVFEPNETLYSHLLGRPSSMNGVYPIEASVSYDDYLIAAHAAATPTSMSSHTQQLWEQTCIGDWLVTPPSRELYALPH